MQSIFIIIVVVVVVVVVEGKATNYVCPPPNQLSPGVHSFTMDIEGEERVYAVYIPTNLSLTTRAHLLFDIHGLTSTGESQNRNSNARELAELEKFVVVHPDGYRRAWNAGDCCQPSGKNDVLFFREMVITISSQFACIDGGSVYAMGFSNGGFMSNTLACNASDIFAAIAPVSAAISYPCNPTRQVPYYAIHGTGDLTVPYDGSGPVRGFNSAVDTFNYWAGNNGCNSTTVITDRPRDDTECKTYTECSNTDSNPTLCTIFDGRHDWPEFAASKNYEFLRTHHIPDSDIEWVFDTSMIIQ